MLLQWLPLNIVDSNGFLAVMYCNLVLHREMVQDLNQVEITSHLSPNTVTGSSS